jgi:hypothetical protein
MSTFELQNLCNLLKNCKKLQVLVERMVVKHRTDSPMAILKIKEDYKI